MMWMLSSTLLSVHAGVFIYCWCARYLLSAAISKFRLQCGLFYCRIYHILGHYSGVEDSAHPTPLILHTEWLEQSLNRYI